MELFAQRAPWYVAGPMIGLAVVALLALTSRPLGASGGWIDLVAYARRQQPRLAPTVYLLLGIAAGGLAWALLAGQAGFTTDYGSFDRRFGTDFVGRAGLLLVAGVLIGYGVRRASGCTSGHGICGSALGSQASFASTVTFMAVAIAATRVVDWLVGARP